MAKAKLDPNNSYEIWIIQINHQLIEASANGDVEECRRLVAIKEGGGANVNYVTFSGYGSTALYGAVKNNHFETVRFLMENGADPGHWKIAELAAFGEVSDPRILDLLFRTTTAELLEQFMGCHHLLQGRLDSAFDCFFGKDYPLVRVLDSRAFETQLLIEYFRILNKYAKSVPGQLLSVLYHHFNKQDAQTCIDVVTFLIRETKLSYYFVYIFLLCFRLDLRQACEITDLINSSAQRGLDDTERFPEYLPYAVSRMVSSLIYSNSSEETNINDHDQFAEKIKKFALKDELLLTDGDNLIFHYRPSHLRKLRFLLERCELDPNRARTVDGDTAVHLLYRNFCAASKGYVEEAVKMLLDNGLHLCARNKSGLRVRTLIASASSQELSASTLIHPEIPRLECLAACEITQANIDTSRLPKPLQKFVNELH